MSRRRRAETGRNRGGPRTAPPPEPTWQSRLAKHARLLYAVLAAFGVCTLIAGTVYALKVEPWVKDRLAGPSRLAVQVLTQTQFIPEGLVHSGIYLFPAGTATPADVPADVLGPDRRADYHKWARASGALTAQDLSVRLTIRALSDPPVLINGLRVDVISRDEPPAGWFRLPETGCGIQPVRQIRLDLDAKAPRAEFLDVDETTGETLPGRPTLTLRVSPDDPEVLEVNARALKEDVRFTLTLLYDSESGTGEYVVGGDEPFRVTALRAGGVQAYETPADDTAGAGLVRRPDADPGPGSAIGMC
jgi:hypothetical protein